MAVRAIPRPRPAPPTNHTATRAPTCTARATERRGRSQLRNHSSTQWPPKENQNTKKVASGQRPSPPRHRASTPPTTSAIVPVRTSVFRRGSRKGCQGGVIDLHLGRGRQLGSNSAQVPPNSGV